VIELAKPPLQSVTSIVYVDTAGAPQTWNAANYVVAAPMAPAAGFGRIQPAYGQSWPSARSETLDAVTITFKAGYGDAGKDVPSDIRAAIMLLIRDLYDGPDLASFARASDLLKPYKVRR